MGFGISVLGHFGSRARFHSPPAHPYYYYSSHYYLCYSTQFYLDQPRRCSYCPLCLACPVLLCCCKFREVTAPAGLPNLLRTTLATPEPGCLVASASFTSHDLTSATACSFEGLFIIGFASCFHGLYSIIMLVP